MGRRFAVRVGKSSPTAAGPTVLVKWTEPSAGAAFVRSGVDPRVSYPRHEVRGFPMLIADAQAPGIYSADITLATNS
jgi:hypothetical protein